MKIKIIVFVEKRKIQTYMMNTTRKRTVAIDFAGSSKEQTTEKILLTLFVFVSFLISPPPRQGGALCTFEERLSEENDTAVIPWVHVNCVWPHVCTFL
jgi:hypothetical protein